MNNNIRRHGLAWAVSVFAGLSGCGGGGGSETPAQHNPPPAPPYTPAQSLTYTPDAAVCAWMAEHVQPFAWPAQEVGPRNWPPAQVETVDTPLRNAQGLAQYRVSSNAWVLQGHYGPQIQSKGIAYSSSHLWAQEASCKHGFDIESQYLTAMSDSWVAYMPDSAAEQVAQEQYTARIQQVRKPDPCKPDFVITGLPLPPECKASTP